jgi:ferredoxin
MAIRKIIKIDESKCNGCSLCIPSCPEGAMQVIDGKARLISDLFCDGLGACIGQCPQGAITIEEREAEEYNEIWVMTNIVKQGKNVIKAHLEHLKSHGQQEYLKEAIAFLKNNHIAVPLEEAVLSRDQVNPPQLQAARDRGFASVQHPPATEHRYAPAFSACPGSKVMDFRSKEETAREEQNFTKSESRLRQWPVQIMLIPPSASYLNNADILIAADCVAFAYADFHADLLKDKVLLVGCPKLDDIEIYRDKFTQIFKSNNIKSITYAHMEVPCCFGLLNIIKSAISDAGKEIPFSEVIISIKGERL